MSLTRNIAETQRTETTVATAVIFITLNEHWLNHDGETPMSHLKVPALVALLLLATPAKDSTLTGLGHYQSETRGQSNAWRGLVPLRSTRADVERLLGPPMVLVAGSYSYETKEEKVRVLYSEGSC